MRIGNALARDVTWLDAAERPTAAGQRAADQVQTWLIGQLRRNQLKQLRG
jgi:hypothetical protein